MCRYYKNKAVKISCSFSILTMSDPTSMMSPGLKRQVPWPIFPIDCMTMRHIGCVNQGKMRSWCSEFWGCLIDGTMGILFIWLFWWSCVTAMSSLYVEWDICMSSNNDSSFSSVLEAFNFSFHIYAGGFLLSLSDQFLNE